MTDERNDDKVLKARERIEELKAKHGKLLAIKTEVGDLFFRRASKVEWDRFQDKSSEDGASISVHATNLALATAVFPEEVDLVVAVFDRMPGVPGTVAKHMAQLVGATEGTIEVKVL